MGNVAGNSHALFIYMTLNRQTQRVSDQMWLKSKPIVQNIEYENKYQTDTRLVSLLQYFTNL